MGSTFKYISRPLARMLRVDRKKRLRELREFQEPLPQTNGTETEMPVFYESFPLLTHNASTNRQEVGSLELSLGQDGRIECASFSLDEDSYFKPETNGVYEGQLPDLVRQRGFLDALDSEDPDLLERNETHPMHGLGTLLHEAEDFPSVRLERSGLGLKAKDPRAERVLRDLALLGYDPAKEFPEAAGHYHEHQATRFTDGR